MKELKTEVRVFRVDAHCDKCGGRMVATGIALMSHPAQYIHVCGVCGHEENTHDGSKYPKLVYYDVTGG